MIPNFVTWEMAILRKHMCLRLPSLGKIFHHRQKWERVTFPLEATSCGSSKRQGSIEKRIGEDGIGNSVGLSLDFYVREID